VVPGQAYGPAAGTVDPVRRDGPAKGHAYLPRTTV